MTEAPPIEYEPAPHASWADLPDLPGGVIVSAHGWYAILRGRTGRQVRELLAGRQRVIRSGPDTAARLSRLAERGVLRERDPGAGAPAGRSITVQGSGQSAALIEDLLRAELRGQPHEVYGKPVPGPCPPGGLAVVVAGPGDLSRANRAFLAAGAPWLLVDPRAAAPVLVGPLFVPGRTGCLECYWSRRSSAYAHPAEYGVLMRSGRSGPAGPWHLHMIAGLAAGMALDWLRADPSPSGSYVEVPTQPGAAITRHTLVPVAACPACGDEASW
ncbi:TOMM precursor leader peptide-binding protein [Nonomuraea angiospora]|uniref:TOMM precursor leader peptide-binding protein n=1 Tax=Nonomuraea angiospora TaxID=46172 RepID=UPI00344F9E7E